MATEVYAVYNILLGGWVEFKSRRVGFGQRSVAWAWRLWAMHMHSTHQTAYLFSHTARGLSKGGKRVDGALAGNM